MVVPLILFCYAGNMSAVKAKDNRTGQDAHSNLSRKVIYGNDSNQTRASSYLLMPADAVAHQPAVASGCWARLYDSQNYGGGALTLSGPLSMPTMLGPFGINWNNRVKSIELGKRAVLTVYDNVDFRQQLATFGPGERIADISEKMGYFDDFSSLRISCKT